MLKECYLMIQFEKNLFYSFWKILKNTTLMVKPLRSVTFWRVGYPNIFFWKYVPLVASKPYTSFSSFYFQKLPSSNILKLFWRQNDSSQNFIAGFELKIQKYPLPHQKVSKIKPMSCRICKFIHFSIPRYNQNKMLSRQHLRTMRIATIWKWI